VPVLQARHHVRRDARRPRDRLLRQPALLADRADALAEPHHVAALVLLAGLGVGRRRSFVDHRPHDATFPNY
jgi:hypothetical protein